MSQQINLFNPIFLKQKKYFSAVTMMQGLGLILAGAVSMYIYMQVHVSSLVASAESTTTQLKSTQAQLAKVSAAYPPRQKSKSIEDELLALQTELKYQKQALDSLQKGGFGNTSGYSEYLRAFARQGVDGLWLTGFTIAGAGNEIQLRGRALQPELVPAYINRLKQEPSMKGKAFSALEMGLPKIDAASRNANGNSGAQRAPTQSQYIEFALQSFATGKEETGPVETRPGPARDAMNVAAGAGK